MHMYWPAQKWEVLGRHAGAETLFSCYQDTISSFLFFSPWDDLVLGKWHSSLLVSAFHLLTASSLWNGTGDFSFFFSAGWMFQFCMYISVKLSLKIRCGIIPALSAKHKHMICQAGGETNFFVKCLGHLIRLGIKSAFDHSHWLHS